uniref:Uncharacterized protein n=1 Tax=Sphaerodactylus townsendi TaxID=933632 RepID=A0ACB8EEX9_9SAUR
MWRNSRAGMVDPFQLLLFISPATIMAALDKTWSLSASASHGNAEASFGLSSPLTRLTVRQCSAQIPQPRFPPPPICLLPKLSSFFPKEAHAKRISGISYKEGFGVQGNAKMLFSLTESIFDDFL